MASAVAFKGFPLAGRLMELPAAPTAGTGKPIATAVRLLNVKRDADDDDDSDDASSVDGDNYGLRRALALADALNLLGEPSKMTQMVEGGGGTALGTGFSFSASGWWVSKEDDDSMQLKVVMPGLGKEHVRLTAEKNVLVIKVVGDKDKLLDGGNKGPVVKSSRRILLPVDAFKMDQIKAEMNNGVLKVTLPKTKDEDRKDVFQIKVE
nr:unnamed protein product [Digitaria exilis]